MNSPTSENSIENKFNRSFPKDYKLGETKYIIITGGVLSGLGKGTAMASIGKVLQSQGYKVTAIKIDPYLNIDAGTMNPIEHGEVWVTEDGGETDQDLGTYERFLDVNISKEHNITTGQIYYEVLNRERRGDFLGKTVEAMPDITDEVKRRIRKIGKDTKADFTLVEIGGTVGEYQNEIFYRGTRLMKAEGDDVLFTHVSYLPIPSHLGEMKTKPTQQSVELLGKLGIQPEFIVCRSELPVDKKRKEKISTFCNVKKENIISNPDLENKYELPLLFDDQRFGDKILKGFDLKPRKSNLNDWKKFVNNVKNFKEKVRIGLVGKYFATGDFELPDAYISVIEAVKHASWNNDRKPEVIGINSEDLENDKSKLSFLDSCDGIIVPGGFGIRGTNGKIMTIQYARENNIPYLGLCFGLQLAVVEYARNVCELENAHSTEMNPNTPDPVVCLLKEQKKIIVDKKMGASMRLGKYPAKLKKGTKVWELYGKKNIVYERHRHRWEVNPEYHETLERDGLVISGIYPKLNLVEYIELGDNFFATQAHPEFKSRPMKPSPMFDGLIKAAIKQ